jgi:hypothetical protein
MPGTVRPDPSTLGVVGERGSHHGGGRLTRNVAAGIKLPKVQRTEMHFLDAEQVETPADVIDPRYGC